MEAGRKAVEEARLDAALNRVVAAFQRMSAAYCVPHNRSKRLGESVKRGLVEMAKSAAEAAAVDVQSVLAAPVEDRKDLWLRFYLSSVWDARNSSTLERRRRFSTRKNWVN